ncbi:hypothetical protein [Parachitinimonas caeni]|uniref:Uncharacterized protein n=1 Tax=Parachitinimonas caeni TaxID=3031301 RepID=A0ABT7E5G4_9NEIS|nr:hypothetical protein [Parachitinimonas caeni]MDK2126700.1 hypothetical protein [Parachitinimonas caeni]
MAKPSIDTYARVKGMHRKFLFCEEISMTGDMTGIVHPNGMELYFTPRSAQTILGLAAFAQARGLKTLSTTDLQTDHSNDDFLAFLSFPDHLSEDEKIDLSRLFESSNFRVDVTQATFRVTIVIQRNNEIHNEATTRLLDLSSLAAAFNLPMPADVDKTDRNYAKIVRKLLDNSEYTDRKIPEIAKRACSAIQQLQIERARAIKALNVIQQAMIQANHLTTSGENDD